LTVPNGTGLRKRKQLIYTVYVVRLVVILIQFGESGFNHQIKATINAG